jgi:hypothetical protein
MTTTAKPLDIPVGCGFSTLQAPMEVLQEVEKAIQKGADLASPDCTQNGSDGVRYRTCYCWTAFNIDYRLVVQYWLEHSLVAKFGKDKLHRSDASNSIPTPLPAQIEKVA